MTTPLKELSTHYNFKKLRLAGVEAMLINIASEHDKASIIPIEKIFDHLYNILCNEYKAKKAQLLKIPVGQVKIRTREYKGFNGFQHQYIPRNKDDKHKQT
jgi:hypothetical protein